MLSGGARESRDNVSGLSIGVNKGIMGWGSTNHGSVRETDGEWSASGRDEGVCRVETGPNYDSDVRVDEEFGQEEVAEVSGGGSMLVDLFSAQALGRNESNGIGNPRTFGWGLGTCTECLLVLR